MARVVLELAIDELANSLGHGFIDTGHLLLGLIREQDGLAGRILEVLGSLLCHPRARSRALVVLTTTDQP